MTPPKRKFRAFKLSLSKYSPKGLFARSLLIIVLPIALMQILVTYLFFDLHWGQVSRFLSEAAAGDVAHITKYYLENPTQKNLDKLKKDAQETLRISVALQENAQLPKFQPKSKIPAYDRTLSKALSGTLAQKYWFDTTRYPDYVDIRVQIPQGTLRFLAYRDRVFASTGGIFILWLVGATIMLAAVSVLFIRNQVRPIERLSQAAESFGRGETVELAPAGSREIRRATQAFLDMRARINRHIEQRTNILAGVSHDLRTPLTRLKLELALLGKSENYDAIREDIKQMEEMLDEYLAFARGQWAEGTENLNLVSIINEIVKDATRNNENIIFKPNNDKINISGREVSLTRCFNNLISNAIFYGKKCEISFDTNEKYVFIHFDDDGPGIEPENYQKALSPFSRLDNSRNQNKKGVGLGLSITRDITHSHGGEIFLTKSPLGGLRATIRLPLSS